MFRKPRLHSCIYIVLLPGHLPKRTVTVENIHLVCKLMKRRRKNEETKYTENKSKMGGINPWVSIFSSNVSRLNNITKRWMQPVWVDIQYLILCCIQRMCLECWRDVSLREGDGAILILDRMDFGQKQSLEKDVVMINSQTLMKKQLGTCR